MTRGFHAFFRQYHNLRALLRRVDQRALSGLSDYPLWHASGHRDSFAFLRRSPPFRPRNLPFRDVNVVLAGSGTTPGVGIPPVLISGRLAAGRLRH